jgi:hypothetical protein
MTSFNEIEQHLKTVSEILNHAKHLASDSYNLLVTDSVTFSVIEHNKFLRRLRDVHYAMAVIELSKLYSNSKNDHYCLRKLLTELKKNHLKAEWHNRISISEIEILESSYKGEVFERKINDLIALRSNYYAHTSKLPPKRRLQAYYSDLMDLIITGEGIVNELSTKILNKPLKFPKYEGDNVKAFFKEYLEIIELAGLYNLHHKKK